LKADAEITLAAAEERAADCCDSTREAGWKKNGESCPAMGDAGSAS
jgi:hypothetical protein